MSLPRIPLGSSGLAVSRIGFGAWAIAGADWRYGWGAQDDADSLAAIRRAAEAGINWIDTAASYGLGRSEELVGRALRGLPAADRPLVFTKGGLILDPEDPGAPPRLAASPAGLRAELEGSLRRLKVEAIDLYQLHWPPQDGTRLEDYWQAMLDFRREGKVRAVGLSNHGAAALARAETLGHVDSLQPPFSAISRGAAAEDIPWARAHGTGVIVYSPMQSGLLSGAFSTARAAALPPDDWRRSAPDFTEPALSRNLALADALAEVAGRHGVATAAVAIAWTLAWPGVTGAIVGARRPAQIDGFLAAATLALTPDDLDTIAAAITRTGAGHGPAHP